MVRLKKDTYDMRLKTKQPKSLFVALIFAKLPLKGTHDFTLAMQSTSWVPRPWKLPISGVEESRGDGW